MEILRNNRPRDISGAAMVSCAQYVRGIQEKVYPSFAGGGGGGSD